MRLLFFTNDFPSPWLPGKGTFNFELVRSLAVHHQMQVVTPISWLDDLSNSQQVPLPVKASRYEARGDIPCHYPRYYYVPKVCRRWYHRFLWQSVKATLWRELHDFRPQAVISYWTHPDGTVAVRYARAIGAKAFVMVGGSDVLLCSPGSRRSRLIADTLKAADGVFAVSRHLRERVISLGVTPERVHVIYRGVDRQRFAPGDPRAARERLRLASDSAILAYVGRLEAVKGLDILLRAAARLRQRGIRFELALVGDGSERRNLERLSTDLDLSATVRFVGSVPHADLADWYRAADWTVLTSHSEGIPNVLLESHACGTPFVATRVGGVPEIAIDGIDRLVAPADPDALADELAAAIAAPSENRDELADRVCSLEDTALAMTRAIHRGESTTPLGAHQEVASTGASISTHAVRSFRANPLRQVLRRGLAAILPKRMFLVGGSRRSGQICLTFDDGPHPEFTPPLLDALARHNVKATFFVIGREAERYPEIVRRIAAEGHILGNHTWSHPDPRTMTSRELTDEVRRTAKLLFELTGIDGLPFRPPRGKVTAPQMWDMWRRGQTIVLWNNDPRDYAQQTHGELSATLRAHPPQSGDIVLLHDSHPHAASAVNDIVRDVRARGLSFATPLDWLATESSA